MSSGPRRRLIGVSEGDAQTVIITAHLQQGAALPIWFPAPFDGILAAAARRRRLGMLYGSVVDHHREDLPLCLVQDGGRLGRSRRGDVWAATCAVPSEEIRDVHWVHGRSLDITGAQRVSDDPLPANAEIGRWKAMRIPVMVIACRTLTWIAIGDAERIRDLLEDVPAIGKKRGQGEGMVLSWDVVSIGAADIERVCWHDDGRIARPFPSRYSRMLGLDTLETVPHASRPPYWRPPQCSNGVFARQWPDVIAPWVCRP